MDWLRKAELLSHDSFLIKQHNFFLKSESPPDPSSLPPMFPIQASLAQGTGRSTDELTAAELVVSSAASKMVASTLTYPHEVDISCKQLME